MSIIVTVVTSRRDEDLTISSYKFPRIKLGSALLILSVILFLILPGAC